MKNLTNLSVEKISEEIVGYTKQRLSAGLLVPELNFVTVEAVGFDIEPDNFKSEIRKGETRIITEQGEHVLFLSEEGKLRDISNSGLHKLALEFAIKGVQVLDVAPSIWSAVEEAGGVMLTGDHQRYLITLVEEIAEDLLTFLTIEGGVSK